MLELVVLFSTLTVAESEWRRFMLWTGCQPGIEGVGGGKELIWMPLLPIMGTGGSDFQGGC